MATTIITDTTPLNLTQYGVRLPDGREFWANGYLKVDGSKVYTTTPSNAYDDGELRTLKQGIFKGINLAELTCEVPGLDHHQRRWTVQRKGEQSEKYWKLMHELSSSTGINALEYEKQVTIISRDITVVVGTTRDLEAPAEDWEGVLHHEEHLREQAREGAA